MLSKRSHAYLVNCQSCISYPGRNSPEFSANVSNLYGVKTLGEVYRLEPQRPFHDGRLLPGGIYMRKEDVEVWKGVD